MARRQQHSTEFNANVAGTARRSARTLSELVSTGAPPPVQIMPWKKQALKAWLEAFAKRRKQAAEHHEAWKAALYQEIGQLEGGVGPG